MRQHSSGTHSLARSFALGFLSGFSGLCEVFAPSNDDPNRFGTTGMEGAFRKVDRHVRIAMAKLDAEEAAKRGISPRR